VSAPTGGDLARAPAAKTQEMTSVGPDDAADLRCSLPCKHVLVPGQAHCLACGEQILTTGLDPRVQRLIQWIERVADLLGYNSI
jgi:hypothetical protein